MENARDISILVTDHHPAFLRMIVGFLEQQCASRIVVVGAAFRSDDALALATMRRPQVILLGMNGNTSAALALIAPLRTLLPNVSIIASAQLGLPEYQKAALAAGADSFLSSDTLHYELLPTIVTLTDHPRTQ